MAQEPVELFLKRRAAMVIRAKGAAPRDALLFSFPLPRQALPERLEEEAMSWLFRAAVFVALTTSSPAFAQTPVQGSPRVRGSSPAIVDAVERAIQQSPTFNQLVTEIAATDGVVYVHERECQRNVLACLVLAVERAGPYRILQIRVDPRRKGHDLIVAIGHELQHALELLNEPTVVNHSTAHNFYQRTAPRRGSSFETQAAVEIGLKIRGELRR